MKKQMTLFISLIIFGAAVYFIFSNLLRKEDNFKLIPRSSDSNISSEFLNAQKAVDFYRQQIEKHPDRIKNYIELAQIFLQEARITGRYHEYIPSAKRLTDAALNINSNSFDALITKASIFMTQHQFGKAKEVAEKAISINSHNAFAFGVLCDAYNELGDYDKAVKACDKMLGLRPDLRSYSRASYIRELHGDVSGAIEAMKLAANAGVFGQENRAWALYNLGNLFLNSGKPDTAAFIYRGILEERPGYGFALNGLAKVCILKKDYSKAIDYLQQAIKTSDEHEFFETLAGIYKAIGKKNKETEFVQKALAEFNEHKSGGWNVDREYAIFCADHNINLDEALSSVKREYEFRQSSIDVLDTYAWVLYKLNKVQEAIPFIEKALRLNTNNNSYFYHAAAIYDKAGNYNKASLYASRANSNNGYMNVLYSSDCGKILVRSHELASR